jgi:hypothetical protein
MAEKQHRLALPPKRLFNDVGKVSPSCKLLSDTAIIGLRMLLKVGFPAHELNGDVQITDPVRFADVAPKNHCLLNPRQKTRIAVQGCDALEEF